MSVRPATREDLHHLARIERAGDQMFVERFGAVDWGPPSDGRWRARRPGFLLVEGEPPVGFAHVLELGGQAHLEQLAVDPAYQHRGRGRALVRAAMAEARRRGHDRLSLRTYADVPWNAPFYAALGFAEQPSRTPLERELEATEERMGLERHGRRILMVTSLTPEMVTDE